jgi:hypothetical protein
VSTNETVDAYVRAWNEPDEATRRKLLESSWADDGVYCDPTALVEGREALIAHIAAFPERFPGARIETRSRLDEHGRHFRFAWEMVDGSGHAMLVGQDFGRLADDGRIAFITGFFGPLD